MHAVKLRVGMVRCDAGGGYPGGSSGISLAGKLVHPPNIDFSAPIFRIYCRTGSLPERMSESVPLHGGYCRHIEDSGAHASKGATRRVD